MHCSHMLKESGVLLLDKGYGRKSLSERVESMHVWKMKPSRKDH